MRHAESAGLGPRAALASVSAWAWGRAAVAAARTAARLPPLDAVGRRLVTAALPPRGAGDAVFADALVTFVAWQTGLEAARRNVRGTGGGAADCANGAAEEKCALRHKSAAKGGCGASSGASRSFSRPPYSDLGTSQSKQEIPRAPCVQFEGVDEQFPEAAASVAPGRRPTFLLVGCVNGLQVFLVQADRPEAVVCASSARLAAVRTTAPVTAAQLLFPQAGRAPEFVAVATGEIGGVIGDNAIEVFTLTRRCRGSPASGPGCDWTAPGRKATGHAVRSGGAPNPWGGISQPQGGGHRGAGHDLVFPSPVTSMRFHAADEAAVGGEGGNGTLVAVAAAEIRVFHADRRGTLRLRFRLADFAVLHDPPLWRLVATGEPPEAAACRDPGRVAIACSANLLAYQRCASPPKATRQNDCRTPRRPSPPPVVALVRTWSACRRALPAGLLPRCAPPRASSRGASWPLPAGQLRSAAAAAAADSFRSRSTSGARGSSTSGAGGESGNEFPTAPHDSDAWTTSNAGEASRFSPPRSRQFTSAPFRQSTYESIHARAGTGLPRRRHWERNRVRLEDGLHSAGNLSRRSRRRTTALRLSLRNRSGTRGNISWSSDGENAASTPGRGPLRAVPPTTAKTEHGRATLTAGPVVLVSVFSGEVVGQLLLPLDASVRKKMLGTRQGQESGGDTRTGAGGGGSCPAFSASYADKFTAISFLTFDPGGTRLIAADWTGTRAWIFKLVVENCASASSSPNSGEDKLIVSAARLFSARKPPFLGISGAARIVGVPVQLLRLGSTVERVTDVAFGLGTSTVIVALASGALRFFEPPPASRAIGALKRRWRCRSCETSSAWDRCFCAACAPATRTPTGGSVASLENAARRWEIAARASPWRGVRASRTLQLRDAGARHEDSAKEWLLQPLGPLRAAPALVREPVAVPQASRSTTAALACPPLFYSRLVQLGWQRFCAVASNGVIHTCALSFRAVSEPGRSALQWQDDVLRNLPAGAAAGGGGADGSGNANGVAFSACGVAANVPGVAVGGGAATASAAAAVGAAADAGGSAARADAVGSAARADAFCAISLAPPRLHIPPLRLAAATVVDSCSVRELGLVTAVGDESDSGAEEESVQVSGRRPDPERPKALAGLMQADSMHRMFLAEAERYTAKGDSAHGNRRREEGHLDCRCLECGCRGKARSVAQGRCKMTQLGAAEGVGVAGVDRCSGPSFVGPGGTSGLPCESSPHAGKGCAHGGESGAQGIALPLKHGALSVQQPLLLPTDGEPWEETACLAPSRRWRTHANQRILSALETPLRSAGGRARAPGVAAAATLRSHRC